MLKLTLVLAAVALTAPPARAQAALVPDGLYTNGDGSMTLRVSTTAEGITVEDPVATALYKLVGGKYEYTSKYGTTFQLYLMGGSPTRFQTLRKGQKPLTGHDGVLNTFKLTTPSGTSRLEQGDGGKDGDHWAQFERYRQKMKSDPANTHLWAACGAAALARSLFNDSEADDYAKRVASSVRPLMPKPGNSPCPDAITNNFWSPSK